MSGPEGCGAPELLAAADQLRRGEFAKAVETYTSARAAADMGDLATKQACCLGIAAAHEGLGDWERVMEACTRVVVFGEAAGRDGYVQGLALRVKANTEVKNTLAAEADCRTLAKMGGAGAAGFAARADALRQEYESAMAGDEELLPEKAFTGCKHYRRKCRKYCPTCSRLVDCRLCHDEKYDHKLPRSEVKMIQCGVCFTDQPPSQCCINPGCETKFSDYYCSICKFHTHIPDGEREGYVWHCDKCGLCRKARKGQTRDDYIHCEQCGMCWPMSDAGHTCRSANATCPCCLDNLHTSTSTVSRLDCGHFLHCNCRLKLLRQGQFACPLCKKTFAPEMFQVIRREVEMNKMPEKLAVPVRVLCNDCLEKSVVRLHYLAMECPKCRGFNTTQIEGVSVCPSYLRDTPANDAPPENQAGPSGEGEVEEFEEFEEGEEEEEEDEEMAVAAAGPRADDGGS
eukprot:TRINITY_DN4523_c0_g3_i1.p1 TRINITY_DN4523_c0_g3~~TRINITY_DN4523_c0_g3_i1.p1  ORF type:complete len:457 (+),score=140.62 TRINITY_DN4523_c0_g3_i1:58-1428(+)